MLENKADTTKKSIHINVSEEIHIAFKSLCAREKLTMHEFLEECIRKFIDSDDDALFVAKDLRAQKENKTLKRVTKTDADSVYRAINGD